MKKNTTLKRGWYFVILACVIRLIPELGESQLRCLSQHQLLRVGADLLLRIRLILELGESQLRCLSQHQLLRVGADLLLRIRLIPELP